MPNHTTNFGILIEVRRADTELIKPLEGASAQFGGVVDISPKSPRGMLGIETWPDLIHMSHHFTDPALGAAFLKHAKDVVVTWLKGRSGRKLKLKVGGRTVEITGPATMDEAIEFVEGRGDDPTPSSFTKRGGSKKKTTSTKKAVKKSKQRTSKRPKKKVAPAKSTKRQKRSKSAKRKRTAK